MFPVIIPASFDYCRDAARKGIVTPEIKKVAEKENMPVEELMKLVSEGKVAICANKNHKCLEPEGVGSRLLLYLILFILICYF